MPNGCRVCGGAAGASCIVREMMFGMGDRFSYFQCERCGCLQIAEIPPDLGRFNPERY